MLLQLILHRPQAIGQILAHTPVWVWGLLGGLVALGLSQARRRTASLTRITVMPVAMTGFAVWGMASAFGATWLLAGVLLAWLVAAATVFALVAIGETNASYDPARRTFDLPGSWAPLALIVGIFLVKYAVGVELALQPAVARDTSFALSLAFIYGAFSGIFAGRAARLLRLARQPAAVLA